MNESYFSDSVYILEFRLRRLLRGSELFVLTWLLAARRARTVAGKAEQAVECGADRRPAGA